MENWKALVKICLIGTERGQFDPPEKDKLKAFGIDMNQPKEQLILESLSFYSQIRKCGFVPVTVTEEKKVELAGLETHVVCNKKSSAHLGVILSGPYEEALPEFLNALIENNQRLPEDKLPIILDRCKNKKELWPAIKASIGERGKWLAKINSDWAYLEERIDPKAWEYGLATERLAYFRHLRNTKPEEAITLLQASWDKESLQSKQALLKVLEDHLSEKDEAFLESCLDERRKEIRKIAARMLSKIYNSALNERMFERLKELIQMKKRTLKKEKLEVRLPDKCDDGMVRDGIDPRAQWFKGGVKASRLGQMLAIVPVAYWDNHFDLTPVETLEIFIRSDWGELLVQASIESAALHKDYTWVAALLTFWMESQDRQRWQNLNIKPLFEMMSPELFNTLVIKGLKKEKDLLDENNPVTQMLKTSKHPWSDKLTLLVISNLVNWMKKESSRYWNGWHFRSILKKGAFAANPSMHETLSKNWPEESRIWSSWEKEIEEFLNTLQFRQTMLNDLKNK